MNWHEFVFSERRGFRLQRHLLFWFAWWLYFSFCDYLLQSKIPFYKGKPIYVVAGSHILLKMLSLASSYAIACYAFIYFLLPLIIAGKWWKALPNMLLLCLFSFTAGYFMYWSIFPFVDSFYDGYRPNNFPTQFWPAIYLGFINPAKVVAVAATIKYVKYWWVKQRENEKLQRENINAELALLKAQVHPDFLFNTLNTIYDHAVNFSTRTSGLLLKLSDLLSYMLYECDKDRVPLAKEMAMMKEYMELERIRHNEDLEMELNIRGEIAGKQIAPFLLVPFIENSFKHCGKMSEQLWINLDIIVEGNLFLMKLANGIPAHVDKQASFSANGLANVQKRLSLLYPGKHELRMTAEQEMLIVLLKIRLDDTHQNSFEEEKLYYSTDGYLPVPHP